MADAAAIQPHDIEEQACIVDAYEWFAKYCSGIMGLFKSPDVARSVNGGPRHDAEADVLREDL